MCVCVHTGYPWTFSYQNLTICEAINVLSSRPCALDIEMKTEMPEGRGEKKAQTARLFGSSAVLWLWPWQAAGIFARGLRVSSPVPLQQMRGSSGYVILWYKSRYGPLPPLYPDNFVFLEGLPSRIWHAIRFLSPLPEEGQWWVRACFSLKWAWLHEHFFEQNNHGSWQG